MIANTEHAARSGRRLRGGVRSGAARAVGSIAAGAALSLALASCASGDPLSPGSSATGTASEAPNSVTIGSAAFSESEVLMYVYGAALEHSGMTVNYQPSIGSREAYIPALQDGSIDIIPEYTGNLLTYFEPDATATTAADVEAALADALPDELRILEPAAAEDKDSLNVTAEFAEEHGLVSIGDLAGVGRFALGANPEFAERAYGIPGLERVYGLTDIEFVAINDSGGPATVKALLDGQVQVADIYTTTPAIEENGLVTLEDPEGLIAAQNVVPLVADRVQSASVESTLDAVSAQLTTADLRAMNARVSGDEKADARTAAEDWLRERGLAG